MTYDQVLGFIRYHGVVLQSARGSEPSLAARITGEPIRGSWWSHPDSHAIFYLINKVHNSSAVLTCNLAGGKITYVHRRLWPAFLCLAEKFPDGALYKVNEVHLLSGRHARQDIPFSQWAPDEALKSAAKLSVKDASAEIEIWLQRYGIG